MEIRTGSPLQDAITYANEIRRERDALRAQLWKALGTNLVNVPEQMHDARDRSEAGKELRRILTAHLREDENREL